DPGRAGRSGRAGAPVSRGASTHALASRLGEVDAAAGRYHRVVPRGKSQELAPDARDRGAGAMNISIFGLGYVGAVSLACLARDGHRVVGVDVDQAKLDLIASGRTPVVEEGMVQLMADVAASGRVTVTRDVREAIARTELSLICVGTPSASNGSQDQTAIV